MVAVCSGEKIGSPIVGEIIGRSEVAGSNSRVGIVLISGAFRSMMEELWIIKWHMISIWWEQQRQHLVRRHSIVDVAHAWALAWCSKLVPPADLHKVQLPTPSLTLSSYASHVL